MQVGPRTKKIDFCDNWQDKCMWISKIWQHIKKDYFFAMVKKETTQCIEYI